MAPYQPLAELMPAPPAAGSLLQSVGSLAGEWRSGVCMPQHDWDFMEWPDCLPDWADYWDTSEVLLPRKGKAPLTAQNNPLLSLSKPLLSSETTPTCEQWCFDPFTVVTPISEVEVSAELQRRLTDNVKAAHDVMFSAAIAKALFNPEQSYSGAAYLPPFIQGANLNATLGYGSNLGALTGILDPVSAYASLIWAHAIASKTTGGAIIHCAPVVLPYLIVNGLVTRSGNRYLGPEGTVVVADAGFPAGAVPRDVIDDSFGTPVPAAPESWMFCTGPIEVGYDTARVVAGAEAADARWNRWALVVEQRAIFRFDPSIVVGVPVCVPAVACPTYSSSVL